MAPIMGGLRRLDVVTFARLTAGMAAAGNDLLSDAVEGVPTVPIHRPGYPETDPRVPGELRASGAVFVNGQKVGDSVKYGEQATGRYQPLAYGGTPIPPGTVEACIVFNAPYAAKQHEQFELKTEPGSGRYFLSSKLYGNAEKYMATVARVVRL